ncbi:hypothetical protein HOU08_gp182 [Dickeya phage vB_DsoM_JA29]|uniref:Uncharacterized protein n=1 Tax=Dickeya phage vB_DsoM_JA29 TaxID=2283031 RepID=A0A384ZXD0_9CAUD|nr:hypothetical protein HOU08_gp182 [Dickeya phage vB_DsoM_JA29]AXG66908.1 hypothetical protein JA29_182 [Dickeya phage vB_DsoM_JA29]
MKVTLDLSAEIQSTSAAAPLWQVIGKGANAKIMFLPKVRPDIAAAFKLAKTAYKEASKYHKTKANLEKLREAQKAKPSDARKTRIATMQPEVRRCKTAATQAMSAASKALRKVFGIKATFGFSAPDLFDAKKFAKISVGSTLKVKGVAKPVTLVRAPSQSVFDQLASKTKTKAKNSTGGTIQQARAAIKGAHTPAKQTLKNKLDKGIMKGSLEEVEEELSKRGRAQESADRAKKSATANKNVKISKSVPESHMKAINAIAKNVTGKNSTLKASGDKIQFESKGFKATIKRDGGEYKLTHSATGAGRRTIRGTLKALAAKLAKAVKAVEAVKGSKLSTGNYLKAAKGISPNAGK